MNVLNWKFDAGPRDFKSREIPLDGQQLPAEGEVHLWYLSLGELARSLRGALDGHSDAADPAPFTPGQLKFARRFYLRLLLGAYLGLPGKAVKINRHVRGKPVLDAAVHGQPLHFSIAKSEDRLIVGFTNAVQMGVDLEPMGRRALNPMGVARRYFSERECAALATTSAEQLDAVFLRAWACKEAVVKASGEGIANQLCRFTVDVALAGSPRILEIEDDRVDAWSLALVRPEAAFLGAVAVRSGRLDIRAFRLLPAAADTGT